MSPTKPDEVDVRQLALGPMKNFVYAVGARGDPEVAVVDPAWDVPALLLHLAHAGKRIGAIILTHHHHDHLNGVEAVLAQREVPIYVQRAEVDFAPEVFRPFGAAVKPQAPSAAVQVGGATLQLLHTPGHTPGSQCIACGGALFSGDTLFVNACGRCDFPGGSAPTLFDSLHRVLGALPDSTTLYPGHHYGDVEISSLGRERSLNPYFQLRTEAAFVAHRMRPRT
jgi:hydroxyacylglutathione hydrolase